LNEERDENKKNNVCHPVGIVVFSDRRNVTKNELDDFMNDDVSRTNHFTQQSFERILYPFRFFSMGVVPPPRRHHMTCVSRILLAYPF
jgi:hypothetical protein